MESLAEGLDSKNVVKHIVNGTLGELCLVCLTPLEENFFESIFTLICKEEDEYCVADALSAVCQFQFLESDKYNVCSDCFQSAKQAYKFHLRAKRSMEIINHYAQDLLNNVNNIEITEADVEKLLCVPVSEYTPTTQLFNFNLDGINTCSYSKIHDLINDKEYDDMIEEDDEYILGATESITETETKSFIEETESIIEENETITEDGPKNAMEEDNILIVVEKEEMLDQSKSENVLTYPSSDDDDMVVIINEKKVRKKRDPMVYMSCSHCPVKYRFISKFKEHMKSEHGVDLYYCKICKITTEHKKDYEQHLKEHVGEHQCTICNAVYKKFESFLAHMKTHEKTKEPNEQLENGNICEQCGVILPEEASLEAHMKRAHEKRYTCHYCGRRYRLQASFTLHIKKHDDYWQRKREEKCEDGSKPEKRVKKQDKSSRSVCQTCGKDFVDERSLLWHQRLHNDDRPFTCQTCGKAFVTLNRRNQHALCAHTEPQRRCPLCPALFHLRSMVNSHVKKVHLKTHKRRNRTSKHQQNVFWRTQPVPIQELSIDLQNDVMELQAAQGTEPVHEFIDSPPPEARVQSVQSMPRIGSVSTPAYIC